MLSKRPYLLPAWYHWMVDNGFTPHIVVNATLPEVKVPIPYVQEGKITLNISPKAVENLQITLYVLEFAAEFGESCEVESIYIPIKAVQAIYAPENGEG